ncbi:MAG TPA: hypothetical protein VIY67_04815 [Nitrospiraceae bacterium]
MTSHFAQKAHHAENRWLLTLLPFILVAESLIATLDPASQASAAECRVNEDGGTIQGMITWKGTASSPLPLRITIERDTYVVLTPSPVPETAQYMNNGRIRLGNTENQDMATIDVCLSQDIRESALFHRAMIASIGTTQVKAHTKAKKVLVLPYKGDRQMRRIGTTIPDIVISVRSMPRTIIGPVQEIQKPNPPDARSMSQPVAPLPSTLQSPSPSGGQPLVAMNPFQKASPLPGNESLRMNLTTAQSVHDGTCADGCP